MIHRAVLGEKFEQHPCYDEPLALIGQGIVFEGDAHFGACDILSAQEKTLASRRNTDNTLDEASIHRSSGPVIKRQRIAQDAVLAERAEVEIHQRQNMPEIMLGLRWGNGHGRAREIAEIERARKSG